MGKMKLGLNVMAAAIAVVAVAAGCPGQAHAQRFQAMGNTKATLQPPPDAKGWVIVTFEGTRAHMSFDLPGHIKLITENGIPYTNGATETYITEEGFREGASYESWNDKDNRYSRMWIESQNEARIVVRHRCALVKGDKICHQEKPQVAPYGPGNWTDEWYVFHPDGTHIRRIKIWSAVAREAGRRGAKYPYELEGMYLWWGNPCRGMTASDHLEDGVITLIKMNGEHKTISLNPYPLGINEHHKMSRVYGDFRAASYKILELEDGRQWKDVLIVWVNASSTEPIEFTIQPEGYRLPRTVVSSDDSEPKLSQEPDASNNPASRKWTSGKYSTQARLITVVDGIVFLKKPDGKTIKVPCAKLSPADQKFLDDLKKRK